jgi:hypothetical protein
MEYFCGTTCFGSLPGVLAKSNGFSALKFGRKVNEIAPNRRKSGNRIISSRVAAALVSSAGFVVAAGSL